MNIHSLPSCLKEVIMKRLRVLMCVVGAIQLALGVLYLIVPHRLLAWMGHSAVAADIAYPLGMLSSRFLVYGALMVVAARDPERHRLLIMGMIIMQLIDLAVGMVYTLDGVVAWSLSAFPMFNAIWIAVLLWWWRPAKRPVAGA